RQTSSCTFRYAPTTSGIHETLLAEQRRRQRLEREMRALAELEEAELLARQLDRGRAGGELEAWWIELGDAERAAIDGLSDELEYRLEMSGDGGAMGRISGMGGGGGFGGIPFRQGSFEYGAPTMGEFLVENATQAGGATFG